MKEIELRLNFTNDKAIQEDFKKYNQIFHLIMFYQCKGMRLSLDCNVMIGEFYVYFYEIYSLHSLKLQCEEDMSCTRHKQERYRGRIY